MNRNRSPYSTGKLTLDGIQWPAQHGFSTTPGMYPPPLNNHPAIPGMHRESLFVGRPVSPAAMSMDPDVFYQHAENQHKYTDQEKSAIALIVSEYEKCKSLYFAEDSISKRDEILLTMATHMDKLRTALKVPDFDCVSSIYGLANNVLSLNVRLPMEKVVKEKAKQVNEYKQSEVGEVILDAYVKLFHKEDITSLIPFLAEYTGYPDPPVQNTFYLHFDGILEEARKKYSVLIGMRENNTLFTDLVELFYSTEKLGHLLLKHKGDFNAYLIYQKVCNLLGTAWRSSCEGSRDHAINVYWIAVDKISKYKLKLGVCLPRLENEKHEYNLKLVCLQKAVSFCTIPLCTIENMKLLYSNYVELNNEHGEIDCLDFQTFEKQPEYSINYVQNLVKQKIDNQPQIK